MVSEDVCSDSRFAAEREHHSGRRSPASKLLVESSFESLGKLIAHVPAENLLRPSRYSSPYIQQICPCAAVRLEFLHSRQEMRAAPRLLQARIQSSQAANSDPMAAITERPRGRGLCSCDAAWIDGSTGKACEDMSLRPRARHVPACAERDGHPHSDGGAPSRRSARL